MAKFIYALLIVALCSGISNVSATAAHAEALSEKATALIDEKGPNAITFDGHGFKAFVDSYMLVSDSTQFVDENGLQISLEALKVPCQATVQYKRTASDVPVVTSVDIEHYLEDRFTDTAFTLPFMKPELPQ